MKPQSNNTNPGTCITRSASSAYLSIFQTLSSLLPTWKMYQNFLLLIITTSAAAQFADCYFPNGTTVPLSRGYQPCISTQSIDSMCCVLNITVLESFNGGYANFDKCLTNGMCQDPNSGVNAGYYRGFCTDKTWKSPNCLNACTEASVSAFTLPYLFLGCMRDGD